MPGQRLLLDSIRCIVFDFGFTLSSDLYFNVAPPGIPDWQQIIQACIFADKDLVQRWMQNKVTSQDIAAIIAAQTGLDPVETLDTMRAGCRRLSFNPPVMAYAQAQRAAGRKTALVTANMDVFTQVVVPAHGLAGIFDVIINSSDYGETDKTILWPLAFRSLGSEISYANSLLIEDSAAQVEHFREKGGFAYQYTGDEEFQAQIFFTTAK